MIALATRIAAAIVRLAPATSPERADAIADAIVIVACPDGETPQCRHDAALLLTTELYESSFKSSVEDGTERGDGGRSWGPYQIHCGLLEHCRRWLDRRVGV